MSGRATLCFVNFSGQNIVGITVSDMKGFEKKKKPENVSTILNGKSVENNSSICGYVELDSWTPTYKIHVTFADSTTLTFTDNQDKDWRVKYAAAIPHSGPAKLQVWRTLGGNMGSGSYGTNALYIRLAPAHVTANSDWMKDLLTRKPLVRLNDLTMPGSHDSGMYLATNGTNARTQSMGFAGQLHAGSRYFDIRTCMSGSDVWTYHGPSFGAKLSDMLDDVKTFMGGRDEAVFLKFSHAYANSRQPTVDLVKSKFASRYVDATNLVNLAELKLSDLKGKVVAVFAEDDASFKGLWDAPKGIIPYHDIAATANVPVRVTANGLTVYDNYANDGTYEEMAADQEPKLTKYGGWSNPYLFLLSWTVTNGSGNWDIEALANTANPWLPGKPWQHAGSAKRPNIIYLDFIDVYLCSAIIDINRIA